VRPMPSDLARYRARWKGPGFASSHSSSRRYPADQPQRRLGHLGLPVLGFEEAPICD
jgi:hypothetical protein